MSYPEARTEEHLLTLGLLAKLELSTWARAAAVSSSVSKPKRAVRIRGILTIVMDGPTNMHASSLWMLSAALQRTKTHRVRQECYAGRSVGSAHVVEAVFTPDSAFESLPCATGDASPNLSIGSCGNHMECI